MTWPSSTPPLIANGKVYVASFSNAISVYGLSGGTPDAGSGTDTASGTDGPGGGGSLVNVALNKTATGSAACASSEIPPHAVNGTVTGGSSDKFCTTAATKYL